MNVFIFFLALLALPYAVVRLNPSFSILGVILLVILLTLQLLSLGVLCISGMKYYKKHNTLKHGIISLFGVVFTIIVCSFGGTMLILVLDNF